MITEIKEKITKINKNNCKVPKADPLTEQIIGCAYKVHSELGPGFNERIYHNALLDELNQKFLICETEKQYKVSYNGKKVGMLKIALEVGNSIVVEVKAVAGHMPKLFESQLLSYLKVTGHSVGLLINFGNKSCQIRRLMRSVNIE